MKVDFSPVATMGPTIVWSGLRPAEWTMVVHADPIVTGVTVVHSAQTPNKRDARRARKKAKK